jgi:hypothetical protein
MFGSREKAIELAEASGNIDETIIHEKMSSWPIPTNSGDALAGTG